MRSPTLALAAILAITIALPRTALAQYPECGPGGCAVPARTFTPSQGHYYAATQWSSPIPSGWGNPVVQSYYQVAPAFAPATSGYAPGVYGAQVYAACDPYAAQAAAAACATAYGAPAGTYAIVAVPGYPVAARGGRWKMGRKSGGGSGAGLFRGLFHCHGG